MNVNNRIAGEALSLNPGTVDAVALQVERFGGDLKMERSNLLRTRLSVEEILLRWMEHFGEETPFYFSMGYRCRRCSAYRCFPWRFCVTPLIIRSFPACWTCCCMLFPMIS